MPLAIKAAQDFCNRHEIEPWCRAFVEKENIAISKAKEAKQPAAKWPPIKGRANSAEKKQIKCFICSRSGHMSYDCLYKGKFNNFKSGRDISSEKYAYQPASSSATSPPTRCHWCNQTNHETKDCRVFDRIMKGFNGAPRGRGRGSYSNRSRGRGRGARGGRSRGRGNSNMGRANMVTLEETPEAVPNEPVVTDNNADEGLDFEDEYFAAEQGN